MTFFDIPVGPASVFMLILMGYFMMTVWFGKTPQPVLQKITPPTPRQPADPQARFGNRP